ncbi:MAG: hypothetical protein DMG06_04885 [Acidobacteria bacterium]|nr:MAG: hypothetical protein DMG06_04885 [Acidobacteriota bacterium]
MVGLFKKSCSIILWFCSLLFLSTSLYAANDILGEIEFVGASKVEKTSGVWVDGQYVGYLKELKGSKKVLLLPGEHEIAVRQAGFKDFTQKVLLEPGQKHIVNVAMAKDPQAQYPEVTAEVKMLIHPNRAAVFVDDRFVGFVDQFDGPGQWLLLAPGKHHFKITLPGYKTFETEVSLLAKQKFELKTDLLKGSILESGPLMKQNGAEVAQTK